MNQCILFRDSNWKGDTRVIQSGNPNQRYVLGAYDPLFNKFNDAVSSVWMHAYAGSMNCSLILFEHASFRGAFTSNYCGGQDCLSNVQSTFNDVTSSAIMVQHPRLLKIENSSSIKNLLNLAKKYNLFDLEGTIDAKFNSTKPSYPFSSIHRTGDITFQFIIDYPDPKYYGKEGIVQMNIPISIHMFAPFFIPPKFGGNISVNIRFYINPSDKAVNIEILGSETTLAVKGIVPNAIKSQIDSSLKDSFESITSAANSGLGSILGKHSGLYTIPWKEAPVGVPDPTLTYFNWTTNYDCLLVTY